MLKMNAEQVSFPPECFHLSSLPVFYSVTLTGLSAHDHLLRCCYHNEFEFCHSVFLGGQVDIVVVNVTKAVKNPWAGDTFFTFSRLIFKFYLLF